VLKAPGDQMVSKALMASQVLQVSMELMEKMVMWENQVLEATPDIATSNLENQVHLDTQELMENRYRTILITCAMYLE